MDQIEIDVVGTLLNYPSQYGSVRHQLREEYFDCPFFRRLYLVMEDCEERGVEITAPNLLAIGKFSSIEIAEIVGIGQKVSGSAGNLPMLARALAEKYICSLLMNSSAIVRKQIGSNDVDTALETWQSTGDSVERIFQSFRTPQLKEDIHAYTDYLEANASGHSAVLPTGYTCLDRLLSGGLALGDLVVLGGVPGSGKSSFLLNIAHSLLKRGISVGFIEGEMTREQVFVRLNAIYAGVDKDVIRSGKNFEQINKPFLQWLYQRPFQLIECFDRTPQELKRRIGYLATVKECKVIIVDYIQVFRERQCNASEYDEVSKTSALLRQLALRHRVCIVAASSLNRSHVSKNEKPGLHSV